MLLLLAIACSSPSSPPPASLSSLEGVDSGDVTWKDSSLVDSSLVDSAPEGVPQEDSSPESAPMEECSGISLPASARVDSTLSASSLVLPLTGCGTGLSVTSNYVTTSSGTYRAEWLLPESVSGEGEATVSFTGPGVFLDAELIYEVSTAEGDADSFTLIIQ